MSPEFPNVRYCPQSNEPGCEQGAIAELPAAVKEVQGPGVLTLEVQGPDGTFTVASVPFAAEATPGHYLAPADALWPIVPFKPEAEVASVDLEEEEPGA